MLIRHSLLFTVAKLVPGLVGIATTALLTRLLDPAAYGLYGLALLVASFGATMVFDWLGLAYLRFSQTPERQAAVTGVTLALFGALAGLTAVTAVLAWAGGALSGAAGPAIAAGLLMMAAASAFELASRVQIAAMRPARLLLMNGGRAVLSFAGATGLAWLTGSPVWAACGRRARYGAGGAARRIFRRAAAFRSGHRSRHAALRSAARNQHGDGGTRQ